MSRNANILFVLFILLFFSYGYFFQSGMDNENARLAQIRAVVEQGVLNTDAYRNSFDVIEYQGKTYPNKAPGTTYIGVIPWWFWSKLLKLIDINPYLQTTLASYFTIWLSLGLISALLGLALYTVLKTICQQEHTALFLTLAYGLGTIAFPFSTLFFSHQFAAAFLFFSFFLVLKFKKNTGPSKLSYIWLGLAGFLGGFAIVTEYPAAIGAGLISIYAVWQVRQKAIGFYVLGFLLGLLPLFVYNLLAFQDLWYIPYSEYAKSGSTSFKEHSIGFMGVGFAKLNILFEILLGSKRGLFLLNPWLVLMIPALILPIFLHQKIASFFSSRLHEEIKGLYQKHGATLVLSAAIVCCFIIFNAGYGTSIVFWGGGFSVGPRHIIPMLPFCALLIAPILQWKQIRFGFYGFTLIGVGMMLMAIATEPRVPYLYENPIKDLFLHQYLWGHFAMFPKGPFNSHLMTSNSVAFNLGKLGGLPGYIQLWPLFLIWIVSLAQFKSLINLKYCFRVVIPFLCIMALLPFFRPTEQVWLSKQGNGLLGHYYLGKSWPERPKARKNLVFKRIDSSLDFFWEKKGSPLPAYFSAEWTGFLHAPESGEYTFVALSKGALKIKVNSQVIIDRKESMKSKQDGSIIHLEQGYHELKINYFMKYRDPLLHIFWKQPGKKGKPIEPKYLYLRKPETS